MSEPIAEEIGECPPLVLDAAEESDYYFESDPLALKGNQDYQQLVKALVKLQAQRAKAVKIPHIEWEKYNVQSLTQGMRPKTRKRIHKESQSPHHEVIQETKDTVVTDGKILIRGRAYDESKPQTFNQSWSDEEQRKLEELLIKYPDETISYQRWSKISKELGTRTPLQVQSRVQKFFIALKMQGLPIPGKNPRRAVLKKPYGTKRRGGLSHSHGSGNVSLFMKAFNMYEEKPDVGISAVNQPESTMEVSDEEDIAEELRNSEEYQELLKLKQVRALKEQEMETGIISHSGFSCDRCGEEPITGTRWHCLECPASSSLDLCERCVKADFSTEIHQSSHVLQPVKALCIRDTMAGSL
ncbi:ZZ-type zinc finger-containing protein 3 isoform X2 [Palaemon carinicauda]|uniref:ZZ-type zinc finger-containing protein 3 isoform X2 n=1 Tax=Palaemon carinicauda TaxID=392227 RepID=UPI0035B60D54